MADIINAGRKKTVEEKKLSFFERRKREKLKKKIKEAKKLKKMLDELEKEVEAEEGNPRSRFDYMMFNEILAISKETSWIRAAISTGISIIIALEILIISL